MSGSVLPGRHCLLYGREPFIRQIVGELIMGYDLLEAGRLVPAPGKEVLLDAVGLRRKAPLIKSDLRIEINLVLNVLRHIAKLLAVGVELLDHRFDRAQIG